jgi:hypothetical protein
MTELFASTTQHTESHCLNCGAKLDASSTFGVGEGKEVRPGEGDMTVCFMCRHVMIYNADLSLRNPTDEEVVDIAGDPCLVSTVTLMGAYHQEKELETRRRENRAQAGDEEASRQVCRAARRAAVAFLKASGSKVPGLE